MSFIINFLKGFIIGLGTISPGISGGSLAVMFGVYEKITSLITNAFYNLKHNLKFYLAVGTGGCIGILFFSRVIEYLFVNFDAEVKYLFIGLMTGTFPYLIKTANKNGFKKIFITLFLFALAITLLLTLVEKNSAYVIEGHTSFPWLVLYGGVLGFGTIIPGISASFILMYLGSYETLLGSISNIDISLLVPLGIGFVLSIFTFAKLVQYLLKNAYGYTYYVILGFVVGSVVSIFPGFELNLKYLFCLFLFLIGFYSSYYLARLEKKGANPHEK